MPPRELRARACPPSRAGRRRPSSRPRGGARRRAASRSSRRGRASVSSHVEEAVEVDVLLGEADQHARASSGSCGSPKTAISPAGDADEVADRADQRRLARAVGPEQAEERAVGDVEVEPVEREQAVVVALGRAPRISRACTCTEEQAPGGGQREPRSGSLPRRRSRRPSGRRGARRRAGRSTGPGPFPPESSMTRRVSGLEDALLLLAWDAGAVVGHGHAPAVVLGAAPRTATCGCPDANPRRVGEQVRSASSIAEGRRGPPPPPACSRRPRSRVPHRPPIAVSVVSTASRPVARAVLFLALAAGAA